MRDFLRVPKIEHILQFKIFSSRDEGEYEVTNSLEYIQISLSTYINLT